MDGQQLTWMLQGRYRSRWPTQYLPPFSGRGASHSRFAFWTPKVTCNKVTTDIMILAWIYWILEWMPFTSSTSPRTLLPRFPFAPSPIHRLSLHRRHSNTLAPMAPHVIPARGSVGPWHMLSIIKFDQFLGSLDNLCPTTHLVSIRHRTPETAASRHIGTNLSGSTEDEFALLADRITVTVDGWVESST